MRCKNFTVKLHLVAWRGGGGDYGFFRPRNLLPLRNTPIATPWIISNISKNCNFPTIYCSENLPGSATLNMSRRAHTIFFPRDIRSRKSRADIETNRYVGWKLQFFSWTFPYSRNILLTFIHASEKTKKETPRVDSTREEKTNILNTK